MVASTCSNAFLGAYHGSGNKAISYLYLSATEKLKRSLGEEPRSKARAGQSNYEASRRVSATSIQYGMEG